MIGRQVSHYRILEKVGGGGMGVVYKAEDIKLGRTVALKFLRPDILDSQEHKARFIHEARAASALEHSNICTLYEIEETEDGEMFICMPLYEGETLRAMVDRAPLKIADSIDIAIQIAEGLQEAHKKGIIHRDMKSGNVIVTPSGQIKIMDFGLAKTDRSTRLTSTGVTLGTIAYMSPEQARGETADHRTDIWSIGVILYEMVAGRLPFLADYEQATLYMIVNREPQPLTSLRSDVPIELERITNKAMAKLPTERYQSAAELVADLVSLRRKLESARLSTSGVAEPDYSRLAPVKAATLRTKLIRNAAIVLAVTVCVLVLVWVQQSRFLPRTHPIQVTNADAWLTTPVLSPDGGRIAYVSDESGNLDVYVIDVHGGSPLNITKTASSDYDPEWLPDGSGILFVSDRGGEESVWKVGQLGGSATLLIPKATWPAISPDGKRIAFSRANPRGELRIAVAWLSDLSSVTILTGDEDGLWDHSEPAWSPDGSKICYSARHNLWLVPSDSGSAWRLTADEDLDCQPTWSPDGRYVYFSSHRESTLALWRVKAKGAIPERVTMGVGRETGPSISGDGKRLAHSTLESECRLVIRDLNSGTETRLPGLKGGSMVGIAPDKARIVFTSNRWGGRFDLWIQQLDPPHSALYEPERLTDHPGNASLPTFSPDGKWIAYYRILGKERDIWIVSSDGGRPIRFTEDPAPDMHPAWSPDGSMLAFESDRSGYSRIWIAPVEDGKRTGPPAQINSGEISAHAPSWSPDGKLIGFQGCSEDEIEIWVVPADGSAAPRQVTKGADAFIARWDPSGNSLLVSGTWHHREVTLKRVSLADGEARDILPPVLFGDVTTSGLFDVSRDGKLLVYRKEDLKGNIWVLEAERGSF